MKKFENVEVFQPNGTGQGGGASLPFNKGYYTSGNSGGFGINFTPNFEPNFKTYKSMKHSKKNIKRKMKKLKHLKEYNVADPLKYNEIELVDVFFYDQFNGFIRFIGDGKKVRDHFRIYNYGNIATDNFYEEELYYQIVAYIYESIPDGKLKDAVGDYYKLTPLPEETYDIASLEEEDLKEECATMGNSNGMGAITPSIPSSTPGDVAGSTPGSGDIGRPLGTFMKTGLYGYKPKKKKKKSKNESFRYIKMFEEYKDKVSFEMTGSPKPYWSTKAEFVADMEKWGYSHTTLNKNTDMLIAADEDLGTLKCKKAEKYGIPIYSYKKAFDQKERLYKRVIRGKKIENIEKNRED